MGSNPTWATEFFNNSVGHFSVGYHHSCCPEDGSNISATCEWDVISCYDPTPMALSLFDLRNELLENGPFSCITSGLKSWDKFE